VLLHSGNERNGHSAHCNLGGYKHLRIRLADQGEILSLGAVIRHHPAFTVEEGKVKQRVEDHESKRKISTHTMVPPSEIRKQLVLYQLRRPV